MSGAGRNRHGFSPALAAFDLLACFLGYALVAWVYAGLAEGSFAGPWPPSSLRHILVSTVTSWIAIAFTGDPWGDGVRLWVDRLFSAIGFNLVVQYGLDYLFNLAPPRWPITIVGSILAIAILAVFQKRLYRALPRHPGGALLLGCDPVAQAILPFLGSPVVGALGTGPSSPAVPLLGGLSSFDAAVASHKPASIIVNEPHWSADIPPRRLLALRYAGVAVQDAPTLFENILKRVCWYRLGALDLLLTPRLNINRSAIALQAIYTNLIGLGLLLLASPLLILISVLIVLTTAAPPFESVECLGFQRIPFRRMRFRTRLRDGKPVWSGNLISRLRLAGLPQLFNVVRGEMALFGPPPVRTEFAEHLARLIPAYVYRFTVKPGIVGWSQANLASVFPAPDECLRLEYDLYYIREESPSLDLDILFRTLFRTPLHPDR
jgi:lipopolysaccharide/colanic/teichoic acid biosynthesis glycosyltransferase